jgi:hypothetical protein
MGYSPFGANVPAKFNEPASTRRALTEPAKCALAAALAYGPHRALVATLSLGFGHLISAV